MREREFFAKIKGLDRRNVQATEKAYALIIEAQSNFYDALKAIEEARSLLIIRQRRIRTEAWRARKDREAKVVK